MKKKNRVTQPEGRGWRLGLTGGIGCGKSTVAACFAKAGWSVLSADMRVREILATNKVVKEALRTRWGASVFDKQDHVNRDAVADRVFKDSNELEWLEELLHPLVQDDWTRAMQEKPRLNWLVEIPLLFEKRLEKEFDFSVCVTCPKAIVVARLTLKGFSKVAIEQRSSQQMALSEKEERADFVLTNSGSLEFLKEQTLSLIAEL